VLRQDPPWKVVRAFALAESGSLVHLNNVSGGVLAGDRLALDVDIKAGAAVQITTTGATRLYRHRAGAADSEQRTTFFIGDGARLEYLPDVVIPYAGSRHAQRTHIRLGRRSTLLWWEVIAPGRLAAGERFAFDRLCVQTEIVAESRPVLREDYILEPSRKDLFSKVRMSEYSHTSSFYAIQEGQPTEFWHRLEDRLNELARERTELRKSLWGASALAADGVVIRGLSASGCYIHQTLIEFWRVARMALTGADAIPPRKIY
jgi:urease accessory protein